MEEKPFESLARGLDKDLSVLLDTVESGQANRRLLNPLRHALGMADLTLSMGRSHGDSLGQQTFQSLSDRFAQQIAVFPLANHVVINEFGAFIPQSIFGKQTDIAYKEERQADGAIEIIIHPKQHAMPALKQSQFGSGRGLIKIANDFDKPLRKDDPIYDIGKDPVVCGVSDASEDLDKYVYGGK